MEVREGEAAAELLTAAVFGGLIWVHAEMVWLAKWQMWCHQYLVVVCC